MAQRSFGNGSNCCICGRESKKKKSSASERRGPVPSCLLQTTHSHQREGSTSSFEDVRAQTAAIKILHAKCKTWR